MEQEVKNKEKSGPLNLCNNKTYVDDVIITGVALLSLMLFRAWGRLWIQGEDLISSVCNVDILTQRPLPLPTPT